MIVVIDCLFIQRLQGLIGIEGFVELDPPLLRQKRKILGFPGPDLGDHVSRLVSEDCWCIDYEVKGIDFVVLGFAGFA